MKIIIVFFIIVMASISTFAQVHYDVNGNLVPKNGILPKVLATTGASDFYLTDTVRFPLHFIPDPGQLSKDGLEYYLSSSFNSFTSRLYVLQRGSLGEQFGSPKLLIGSINDTNFKKIQPSITADKKTIVFVRSTDESWEGNDLYIATRSDSSLPFDMIRPLSELNTPNAGEGYPWISPDGLRLYFSKGMGSKNDLFVSKRQSTNGTFESPSMLDIPLSANRKFAGWLGNDEQELYFTTGTWGDSIMYSIRTNQSDTSFSTPTFLPSLSQFGFVSGVSLAGEELYLYNARSQPVILKFQHTATSIEDGLSNNPRGFELEQNYPNPFNPTTTISFSISKKSFVSLKVFDALGREVSTLVSDFLAPGQYSHPWFANGLPSGLYFYRLNVGLSSKTKKLVLIK
ncbi:MAG: T9SS type A sorting domain-containing protein [Bacteroidetes bacterium]|nr:T9SS type A sorting domain-containing protein [Bacteroidota bacterium]